MPQACLLDSFRPSLQSHHLRKYISKRDKSVGDAVFLSFRGSTPPDSLNGCRHHPTSSTRAALEALWLICQARSPLEQRLDEQREKVAPLKGSERSPENQVWRHGQCSRLNPEPKSENGPPDCRAFITVISSRKIRKS